MKASQVLGKWSATLTLPDYGRVARHSGAAPGTNRDFLTLGGQLYRSLAHGLNSCYGVSHVRRQI